MKKTRKPGRCRRAVTRNTDWRARFLKHLSQTGNITLSAEHAGVGRATVHDRRKGDEAFAAACVNALAEAADRLEGEARRRAYEGVDEPVIHHGEMCGVWVDAKGKQVAPHTYGATFVGLTVKKYSDALLMFLLRAAKPKRFRENHKVEHSGKVRQAHRHDFDLSKLSVTDLETLLKLRSKATAAEGDAAAAAPA